MRLHLLSLVIALGACQSDGQVLLQVGDTDDGGDPVTDTGADEEPEDTGEDTGDDAGGDTGSDTGEEEPPEPSWCLGFEDDSLLSAGYSGKKAVLYDGAILEVVAEGEDFSALAGEERLELREHFALLMRSNDEGDPTSVAIATTPPFTVDQPHLGWWTLSEVDERGVVLYADLLDDNGTIVASMDLEAQTGGFVPALGLDQDPIEGFDEIGEGEGIPGSMVQQLTDVSAFEGQELRLRLYQHTRVDKQGFFTLFDDICLGELTSEDDPGLLPWGDPDPSH